MLSAVRATQLASRLTCRVATVIPLRNKMFGHEVPDEFNYEVTPHVLIPVPTDLPVIPRKVADEEGKEETEITRKDVAYSLFPDEPPNRREDIRMFDLWSRWKWANDVLYGKDRDLVNHPEEVADHVRERVYLRHSLFPEWWFTNLYDKTGVTGPYFIGFAGVYALLAKGWLIFKYKDTMEITAYGFLFWRYTNPKSRFFNNIVRKCDILMKMEQEFQYADPVKQFVKARTEDLERAERNIAAIGARCGIGVAQMENLGLCLEDEYRNRMQQVFKNVKNKLDYQLSLETTKKNFEQEYMVNWITNSVINSITPELEKKNIASCINQLRALSKTANL